MRINYLSYGVTEDFYTILFPLHPVAGEILELEKKMTQILLFVEAGEGIGYGMIVGTDVINEF